MIRNSIYNRPKPSNIELPQSFPPNVPSQIRKAPQERISYNNATIDSYLNTRRITKDRLCLVIFVVYVLGLVIMLGLGFFYGNYDKLGVFVNANAAQAQQEQTCNTLYLNENMTVCSQTCPSGFAYLGRVCLTSSQQLYNPSFSSAVDGLISMYGIKYTFQKITYVSASLLVATGILFVLMIFYPKIIYIFTATLFFMLLGMAFYLLKNFETRVADNNIQPNTIFYTNEQSTRFISFFFLGLYLLIFPFVLFSPKKIQLGTYIIQKLYEFYKNMSNTIIFTFVIIVVAWGSLIMEIFLVMNFYTTGTVTTTPVFSMFHTFNQSQMYMSHPVSLAFHFIGVFWFYSALISWHKYFIGSSMCLWYFQDSQSLYPIKRGLKRSLHHIGSAALDGILVPIQWLFMLLYSIFKTNDDKEGEAQDDIHSCLSSCFNAFSGFFIRLYRFINRNSPCSAVLTNQDYFSSCKHSAETFSINKHRFFNIGGTLTIFLTLFVCILWVVVMYFAVNVDYTKQYPPVINSVVLPVFCVFVIGLVVGSLFTNLFTASVDGLLFCYLEERKSLEGGQNGGQLERKDDELKIKIVLDQCYYKSAEQAKTSVFIYEERDENTLDITYLAKKQ